MNTETSTETTTDRPRLQLSATQVVASALAAVTATFCASYLGVAGTVIGAGVASVLTVVGNAVYSHSLQRVARMAPPPAQRPIERTARPGRRNWLMIAAACAGLFAGVLAMVTVVELVAGRPLSDVVRGRSGSGTSVLGDVGTSTRNSTPSTPPASPAVTVTVTPSVVTRTPTVTVTGRPVTVTTTPTARVTAPAAPTAPTSSSAPSSDTATPTSSPSAATTGP